MKTRRSTELELATNETTPAETEKLNQVLKQKFEAAKAKIIRPSKRQRLGLDMSDKQPASKTIDPHKITTNAPNFADELMHLRAINIEQRETIDDLKKIISYNFAEITQGRGMQLEYTAKICALQQTIELLEGRGVYVAALEAETEAQHSEIKALKAENNQLKHANKFYLANSTSRHSEKFFQPQLESQPSTPVAKQQEDVDYDFFDVFKQ